MAIGWAAGCSDKSSPSAATACADQAQARCTKRSSCTNTTGITRLYGDMTTCMERETLACLGALSAPNNANNPAHVEGCVAALASVSCSDFLTGQLPAACISVGPGGTGAACAFNGQCMSSYCGNAKAGACGACAGPPNAGDSCLMSSCAAGQECVASTNQCQVPGASGRSCDSAHPCAPDLACVGATGGATGTCTPASPTMGAPCGGTEPPCDGTKGLYCGGAAGARSCMPIAYVGDGQCGALSTGNAGCARGNCYTAAGTIATAGETGTCKAAAADGGSCDLLAGPTCLLPARCVIASGATGTAGTCTIVNGSACM
jgi:hypothetical protein